ncbi:MAG TPA: glutathione S-transferase family protein [Burkholderiaceae bacterium]|jgi:glutathione S-transferase|nr:glutathione S-transferase family protein [Burkholderiaceae bacterium]
MQLIGMLDSPFVRRTAIAARLLGIAFEHRNLSVFADFDLMRTINPAVKVPTLVCDDGTVLMESGLILDYFESLAGRSLWPAEVPARRHALRVTGLALVACEKVMQMVVEKRIRAPQSLDEAWYNRVKQQLAGALAALDKALAEEPLALDEAHLGHAAIITAVMWRYAQVKVAGEVLPAYPTLADFVARAERLPVFATVPFDEAAVLDPA